MCGFERHWRTAQRLSASGWVRPCDRGPGSATANMQRWCQFDNRLPFDDAYAGIPERKPCSE